MMVETGPPAPAKTRASSANKLRDKAINYKDKRVVRTLQIERCVNKNLLAGGGEVLRAAPKSRQH